MKRPRRPGRLAAFTLATLSTLAALLLFGQGGGRVEASPRRAHAIARAHFARGERLYLKDQYAEALLEFEAGYAALPLPGFLVNIGQCRRRLGDPTAARESYEKFLARVPHSPLAPAVRELVQELTFPPSPSESPAPAPPGIAAPSLAARSTMAEPPPTGALVMTGEEEPASRPVPEVKSRRGWWIWGALAVTTIVAGALVIGSASADGTTTTIHDGTIGTLRR